MTVHDSPERRYRATCRPKAEEQAFQVVVEHSDLWIVASQNLANQALQALQLLRGQLKGYIAWHPGFAESFAPVLVEDNAPGIIKDMALAAARCGVGPMAAVAGAVAEHVATALQPLSRDVLVENGGDLFMHSAKERVVGLLPDPQNDSTLGVLLSPEVFPLSLCASSATIGHSVSLGSGELVVVRSQSGAFADAAATALCNLLQTPKDLDRLLHTAQQWAAPQPGYPAWCCLQGVFAQCKGRLAVWGEMELAAL